MKIKALFPVLILFTFPLFLKSQPTQGGMRYNGAGVKPPAIGRIYGKVVDSRSKSIEYATVTLLAFGKDSLITGALTQSNGDFSFGKDSLLVATV